MFKWILCFCLMGLPLFGEDLMEEYYPERTQGVLEQALAKNSRKILCGRIKIKEGTLGEVREWFKHLNAHREELLEAFALEGVWLESVFLEHTPQGDYLIYSMRQEDIEKVYAALAQHELPIRLFHVECWKKCCEECVVLEPLFDLERK